MVATMDDVLNNLNETNNGLVYNFKVDNAIISIILLSKAYPQKGSEDYSDMIEYGKIVLDDAVKTGNFTISPLVKMMVGGGSPITDLQIALGYCGLREPLT